MVTDQSEVTCHNVQSRYWQEFIDLKRDAFYMRFYHGNVEKIDRILSCISAIASSSAIAGWVIWRKSFTIFGVLVETSLIWGIIIMASHVLNAVKEYLPYKKRFSSLSMLSNELDAMAINMEDDWFRVSHGLLTEEQIHELHMKMKRLKNEAGVRSFSNTCLPPNRSLLERANSVTREYVQSFYGSDNG